jgi:cell division protein FtsB
MTITWYHETKEAPDFDARIAICDEDGTWAYMSEIEALEAENLKLKEEIKHLKEDLK